jgi:hypothetical protein
VRKIDSDSFFLEGLNISGSNLSDLLNEVRAFDQYLKNLSCDEAVSTSLLFHGIPGSGKRHSLVILLTTRPTPPDPVFGPRREGNSLKTLTFWTFFKARPTMSDPIEIVSHKARFERHFLLRGMASQTSGL